MAVVERFKARVSVRTFCPLGRKKAAVVERWPLADVILYQGNQLHYPLDDNLSGG